MDEYNNDKRTACKYGSLCYQKNPQHHTKYKHPPSVARDNVEERETERKKKRPSDDHSREVCLGLK